MEYYFSGSLYQTAYIFIVYGEELVMHPQCLGPKFDSTSYLIAVYYWLTVPIVSFPIFKMGGDSIIYFIEFLWWLKRDIIFKHFYLKAKYIVFIKQLLLVCIYKYVHIYHTYCHEQNILMNVFIFYAIIIFKFTFFELVFLL